MPGSKPWVHETFLLAGLAAPDGENRRNIYVHSKAMLVDDAWTTIGSCNLHSNSLSGHTEMNTSIWDGDVVRTLRCRLLQEHLDEDTSFLSDRASLRRYREIARVNAFRRRNGNSDLQGLALALDPTTYDRDQFRYTLSELWSCILLTEMVHLTCFGRTPLRQGAT